jgi:nitrate reductase NapAB chaperone NapD
MLIEQIHSRLEYIKHCDIYEARTEIDKLISIIAETEKCQQLLEIQAKLDELLKSPVVEYKTDWT